MSILQEDDEVSICKRALGLAEHFADFDGLEDNTQAAREARLRYDPRRRLILETLDWNFARRRAIASLRTDVVTPFGLPVAVARAQQQLRVREVNTEDRRQRFLVEEHVFTDHHEVGKTQIVYTADETRHGLFAPSFVMALELLLAADFCIVFGRSLNRSNEYRAECRRVLQSADEIEGMERSDDDAYAPTAFDQELASRGFGDVV